MASWRQTPVLRLQFSLLLITGILGSREVSFSKGETVNELTWSEAIKTANDSNPELKAANAKLSASENDLSATYGAFWPQVSGSASYTDSNSISSSTSSKGPTYSLGLAASENLFAGFRDAGKISNAKALTEQSRATLEATRARVIADLAGAFAGMKYGEDAIELARSILKRREENVHLVQLRFESGRENKGSLELAKANLEQAKLEMILAAHALEVARENLMKALGFDSTEKIGARGSLPVLPIPDEKDPLEKLALDSLDVKIAQAQFESSNAGVTTSRSTFFPSLDLSAQIGRLGSDFIPANERWSMGITLSIPLFSGGHDYYAYRSAVAQRTSADASLMAARAIVLAKLAQTRADFVEADQRLKVDQSFYHAARVRSAIAREKYNNGLISFDDWDIIETDLVNRGKNALASERNRAVSQAAWMQALGKGNY